ncbi:Non-heme chloroperoxidase [Bienertia sinuspersici]
MTIKPLATLTSTGYQSKMGVPFELKDGQNRHFHELSSGLKMEGESDDPAEKAAGTLQTHAADIAHFIEKELTSSAVLVGHSFGGLLVQYYLSSIRNKKMLDMSNGLRFPELAGAVLVCSVPPSGNSGLVWRYLLSKPVAAFKVTRSLAAKAFMTDLPLCKETFFSTQMDDILVQRLVMLSSHALHSLIESNSNETNL